MTKNMHIFALQAFTTHRLYKGFSLIELLVVMAIMGILLAVSLPSFQQTIESNMTNSQAKLFLTTLSLARSEAIKRGGNVGICASTDGTDCDAGSWNEGWLVFHDANEDSNGAAGSVDAGDTIIRVFDPLGAATITTFTVNWIEYSSLGYSATPGTQTLLICPTSGTSVNARSIEIGPSGRGRRIENGLVC